MLKNKNHNPVSVLFSFRTIIPDNIKYPILETIIDNTPVNVPMVIFLTGFEAFILLNSLNDSFSGFNTTH